jgi:hypothetical protein
MFHSWRQKFPLRAEHAKGVPPITGKIALPILDDRIELEPHALLVYGRTRKMFSSKFVVDYL